MKLTSQHHDAISLLIEGRYGRKSLAEIAEEIGVTDRTLRRWRDEPVFQSAYSAALNIWRKDLSDIRLTERRERLTELERIYDCTPDSAGTNAKTGIEVSNASVKCRILDQIASEVGDKVEGPPADSDPTEAAKEISTAVREMLALTGGGPNGALNRVSPPRSDRIDERH